VGSVYESLPCNQYGWNQYITISGIAGMLRKELKDSWVQASEPRIYSLATETWESL